MFLLSRAVYFSVNLGLGALAASSTRRLVAPLCCVCCAGVFGVSCICSSLGCARACMRFLGLSCVSFWFLVSGLACSCLIFSLIGFLACCLFGCVVFVLFLLSFFRVGAASVNSADGLLRPLSFFSYILLMRAACFCRFVCRFAGLLFVLLVCPLCFLLVGLSSSLLLFSVPLSFFSFSSPVPRFAPCQVI